MNARKRLFKYIAENRWQFLVGAVLGGVVAILDLKIATLLKPMLTAAAQAGGGSKDLPSQIPHWSEIKFTVALFLLFELAKAAAMYGNFYAISAATNRIATTVRGHIYEHLHRLSLSFFERSKTGDMMSRMTNDVGLIQNGAGAVVDAVVAPLTVLFGIIQMFRISWSLALASLVFAPAMSWVITNVARRMRSLTVNLQETLADVAVLLQETLSGIRIVKSFGMESWEIDRFAVRNRASLAAALRAARRNAAIAPITEVIGTFALGAAMLLGGYQMMHGIITFGDFCVFIAIGFLVSNNTKKVSRLGGTYYQTMAGVERIFEILDERPDIADSPDAIDLDAVRGEVEFRDVYFSYQTGEQVLSGISFAMQLGKSVAVVGPSGAGKSTIANVIPRFYDVSGGGVFVDGHDVRSVTLESLRRHIGIVPQETVLFSGTIRDNIAYGKPDATDEEVENAARAANAHSFIEQMENGYDSIIGERGVRLSGGERQRISIARAILKDPKILILDEATSSLDSTSERLVQEALESLMSGRTTLVIAHRLSTITKADEIIVLSDGKIVEQGNFAALMDNDGLFARLYRAQFDLKAIGAPTGAGIGEEPSGQD